jgi:hypothetical protein
MTKSVLIAVALIFVGQSAWAGAMTGNGALSFAALIGQHAPQLDQEQKGLLLNYLNGEAEAKFPEGGAFSVKADSVTCRISNVDITFHSCDLTFGATNVTIKGRVAHELYATLIENGVPGDGAAGSNYEAIGALDCTINPGEVASRGGGGAKCDFAPAK